MPTIFESYVIGRELSGTNWVPNSNPMLTSNLPYEIHIKVGNLPKNLCLLKKTVRLKDGAIDFRIFIISHKSHGTVYKGNRDLGTGWIFSQDESESPIQSTPGGKIFI